MSEHSEATFSVSGLLKRQFERGYIDRVKVSWCRFGPIFFEWHGWWRWRLGVCFGAWYAGCLVGPAVITLGKRRFLSVNKWKVTWIPDG